MARPLSDRAIDRRVMVARHRAHALARNPEYRQHIARVREGVRDGEHDVMGCRFSAEGFLDDIPVGPMSTFVDEICQRSGLSLPMLPERLHRVTLEELAAWWQDEPLFDDLPGWRLDPKNVDALRQAARAGFTVPRRAFHRVPVPLRPLRQRHRGLEDFYALYWQVLDRRALGETDAAIAAALWPDVMKTAPDVGRQRVYDYLDAARTMIAAAYPPLEAVPHPRVPGRRRPEQHNGR